MARRGAQGKDKVAYDKSEGVGPGERRLAKILNGTVQGGSVTHDLDTPYGTFEVKEPNGSIFGEFRVEAIGIAALEPALARIKEVVKQINSCFGTGAGPNVKHAMSQLFPESTVDAINRFVSGSDGRPSAAEWIVRGEIGFARMRELATVVKLISAGLANEPSRDDASRRDQGGDYFGEERYVELGDTETGLLINRPVSTQRFITIGKMLGADHEDMAVNDVDVLKSMLTDEAFDDPAPFVNMLTEPVTGLQVFGHVDGLILVNQQGYIIVPKRDFNDRIKFFRISKAKPYFKYVK